MSGFIRRQRRRRPEINIVPLIDVLVVLIFFFIITMQFRNLSALNITPPEMESSGQMVADERPLVIGVDEDGSFYFNDSAVSKEELSAALQSRAETTTDTTVLILAAENVPLRFVTEAMDQAKKSGFHGLRLQTR